MSTTEQNGLLTYKDEAGNLHLLYPVTKAELVDGLDEALVERFTNEEKAKLAGIEAGANKLKDGVITVSMLASNAKSTGIAVTLAEANWVDNTQTIAVEGVTAVNNVLVAADPTSREAYSDAEIYCSAQADGSLTFACGSVPAADVLVNVIILI